jgi:hypothetical protein
LNRIIIGLLISVTVMSFYISSVSACVVVLYNSPSLVILDSNCAAFDVESKIIEKYVVQGYEIKTVIGNAIYLTKTVTK